MYKSLGSWMTLNTSRLQLICLLITFWLLGLFSSMVIFEHSSPKYAHENILQQNIIYKKDNICNPISTTNINTTTDNTADTTAAESKEEKPILLLWFPPENFQWDFNDCKTIFNIDSCHMTQDRNLYDQADAVLIYHKSISWDLSNLPPSPRPLFQKWIWFHFESPTNTAKIPGLENLFNLTLSYRRDADISVRYSLTVNKKPNEDFVIPKKDKLLCWFVSNLAPSTGVGTRMNYYNELKKYINIHIFGKMAGNRLPTDDYYSTMSSCKFYLSFENSIHKDYITEKLNGPLSVGTVPVTLGPPRQNYEEFTPGNAFIHVDDFPSPEALANHLLQLDKDEEAYKRYFDWRKHVTATPHLTNFNQEFVLHTCHVCDYISRRKEYKVAHDIYKWYFTERT